MEAQNALAFHNGVRKDVGAAPLQWSALLARFAQAWADHLASTGCKMKHRPYNGEWKQQYGENIYWGSNNTFLATDAAKRWYNEINDYQHIPLNVDNLAKVGHYTQMVWKGSTAVGMGKASCPNGATIIVANYDPMGNQIGKKAY